MNNKHFILFTVFLLILAGLSGCDYPEGASLFTPDYETLPDPVIAGIDPPGMTLAGIGSITISGENFSSTAANNLVYFDGLRGTVLGASPTQLEVRPPIYIADSIRVRVAVIGAEMISNELLYRLEAAVERWGGFSDAENPGGLTTDGEGNVYAGVFNNNTSSTDGIIKITPSLEKSSYGLANHTRPYRALRFGSDGYLYSATQAATRPLIARIPPDGGTEQNWLPLPVGTNITDIEFDEYGFLWAAGNNNDVFRINTSEGGFTAVPYSANVRNLRYYNGHLYVSGSREGNYNIWRLPVDAEGNLGSEEVYFAFSNEIGVSGAIALAITFAEDGTLYIGSNTTDGIIVVHPDRSWEPLYPGLLPPRYIAFTWDQGVNMFATRQIGDAGPRQLYRINMQKEKAPYY
jgi:hypothetical protein